jgi:hypothetical protein
VQGDSCTAITSGFVVRLAGDAVLVDGVLGGGLLWGTKGAWCNSTSASVMSRPKSVAAVLYACQYLLYSVSSLKRASTQQHCSKLNSTG